MRLSTNTIYNMSMRSILQQQGRVADVGQQLASGKKMVTPADDPRAAAQSLVVSQSAAVNEQFTANRTAAKRSLGIEEAELDNVTSALQAASPLLVQAGNGTLSDADRGSLATRLEGIRTQLLGSANAQDGNGRHIFAGFDGDTIPFVENEDGKVSYNGDANQQQLKVDASRLMPVSDTGTRVFNTVTVSAQYIASAEAGNEGAAVFGGLNVLDASAEDYGDTFSIRFARAGENVTYSIMNDTTDQAVVDGAAYVEGKAIALGESMGITIEGAPEDGDAFVVARNRAEDNNIFDTLGTMIDALKSGTDTPKAQAAFDNVLSSTQRKVANSLDNVLTVRASLGSRLNELDTLDMVGESRALNYKSTRSQLEDLDYVSAISEYSLAQVALQFSQQTFTDIQKLSLFNLS